MLDCLKFYSLIKIHHALEYYAVNAFGKDCLLGRLNSQHLATFSTNFILPFSITYSTTELRRRFRHFRYVTSQAGSHDIYKKLMLHRSQQQTGIFCPLRESAPNGYIRRISISSLHTSVSEVQQSFNRTLVQFGRLLSQKLWYRFLYFNPLFT